jgi:hypothetical protein
VSEACFFVGSGFDEFPKTYPAIPDHSVAEALSLILLNCDKIITAKTIDAIVKNGTARVNNFPKDWPRPLTLSSAVRANISKRCESYGINADHADDSNYYHPAVRLGRNVIVPRNSKNCVHCTTIYYSKIEFTFFAALYFPRFMVPLAIAADCRSSTSLAKSEISQT